MSDENSNSRFAHTIYRVRWPASLLTLALVLLTFQSGWEQIERYSAQVALLSDDPQAERAGKPEPQMFDPRSDIWFDPDDKALSSFAEPERRFVAEDLIFVGFRDDTDPMGAFSLKALDMSARLTKQLEAIPYVRNVRSLTQNPWIRWGTVAPGEEGLLVGDLFAKPPAEYNESERIARMVSVLGAARASSLIGEQRVRSVLGPDAKFEDHLGDPRLVGNIVSADGRSAAIQVQVLRPVIGQDRLSAVFPDDDGEKRSASAVIHKSTVHNRVVAAIDAVLAKERAYETHLVGQRE
jgi:hypothetical protein